MSTTVAITVNGNPLDEYVEKKRTQEIERVYVSDIVTYARKKPIRGCYVGRNYYPKQPNPVTKVLSTEEELIVLLKYSKLEVETLEDIQLKRLWSSWQKYIAGLEDKRLLQVKKRIGVKYKIKGRVLIELFSLI